MITFTRAATVLRRVFFHYFLSSDHKTIGSSYLVLAIVSGTIGAFFSFMLRLAVDFQMFDRLACFPFMAAQPQFFSLMTTSHALMMVFFTAIPALIGGFANWMVPLMIGSRDVAFPRLNRLAFWLLVLAFVLMLVGFYDNWAGEGAVVLLCLAIGLAGCCFLLTFGILFVTISTMRLPTMQLLDMPIFVWSILLTSFFAVVYFPVMLAAVTINLLTGFSFNSDMPSVLLFLSHLESYVLLLPALGVISQIVTTFAKRQLVFSDSIRVVMAAIGVAGFVLWSENLFLSTDTLNLAQYFTLALPLIGGLCSLIIVSWVVTIAKTSITWSVPMLWVMGFIMVALVGGLLVWQQGQAEDGFFGHVQSYVSHFHYVGALTVVFAIFAAWSFWFPKMSGYEMRAITAKIHFWLFFLGVHMMFLPHCFSFDKADKVAVFGVIFACFSVVVFLYSIVEAFCRKITAKNSPWGEGATTLEWHFERAPQDQ